MSAKPEDFGPPVWDGFHYFAAHAKTPEKRKEYKRYAEVTLLILLPCDNCIGHFGKILKRYDINQYMGSNEQLLLWSYLIHDAVNKDLRRRSPSYHEVKRKYLPEPGMVCTTTCSVEAEVQSHTAKTQQKPRVPAFHYK
jgi:hypothetical protein